MKKRGVLEALFFLLGLKVNERSIKTSENVVM